MRYEKQLQLGKPINFPLNNTKDPNIFGCMLTEKYS